MDNEERKEVLATDVLVKLAVNVRAIEHVLRRLLKTYQNNYDMYIGYYFHGFDTNSWNIYGTIFDLTFRNKTTDKEHAFRKTFYYSDIFSKQDVISDEIVKWVFEIDKHLNATNSKGE